MGWGIYILDAYEAAQRTEAVIQARTDSAAAAERAALCGADADLRVIVWLILGVLAFTADPLWGLISAVVVTELKAASAMERVRFADAEYADWVRVALAFLRLFWGLGMVVLLAMALAIIVSADLVKVPISWRIAPITAAIVMTPAYASHSPHAGLTAALQRDRRGCDWLGGGGGCFVGDGGIVPLASGRSGAAKRCRDRDCKPLKKKDLEQMAMGADSGCGVL